MKANEARELALKTVGDKQYPEIIREIVSASKKGNLECWIYYPFSEDVRNRLTEDGYSVGNTQFDRNEHLTKIEW